MPPHTRLFKVKLKDELALTENLCLHVCVRTCVWRCLHVCVRTCVCVCVCVCVVVGEVNTFFGTFSYKSVGKDIPNPINEVVAIIATRHKIQPKEHLW